MKKLLLYGHGGAYNHGAEAILRSSISILRQADCPILLSTHFPVQDQEFGLDKLVDRLIPADFTLVSQERMAETFEEREQLAAEIYRAALSEIDGDTVCIAVGGDNYCYPNWHRQSVFHRTVKRRGGTSILWGCSIQPEMMDDRMTEVLKGHDHIYARESLTANALRAADFCFFYIFSTFLRNQPYCRMDFAAVLLRSTSAPCSSAARIDCWSILRRRPICCWRGWIRCCWSPMLPCRRTMIDMLWSCWRSSWNRRSESGSVGSLKMPMQPNGNISYRNVKC